MKWFYRVFIFVAILATLAALGVILLRSGPAALVPSADPAKRLNAEHADLAGNAARYYTQAITAMSQRVPAALILDRIPQDAEMRRLATEWVAANRDALDLALQGTAEPAFWIDVPSDWTAVLTGLRSSHRELAKLIAASAWLEVADGNPAEAARLTIALDSLGRHFALVPTLVDQLLSMAIRALAQELVLAPLTGDLRRVDDVSAYAAAIEPCFEPTAGLAAAIQTETDVAVWSYAVGAAGMSNMWLRIIAPPTRLNGECQRRLKPVLALLEQPVEAWTDPRNPHLIDAQAIDAVRSPPWRTAAMLAELMGGSSLSIVERAARSEALRRGNWTVLQVLRFADEHGAPPRLLAELPPGGRLIDPCSGRPFVYRADGDSFVVYSLGFDRDDDGGCHDPRWGQAWGLIGMNAASDGDYVFWPPTE